MKGGGARARLDGLESHCKWGNRIAPTQWTKIEALLTGLTVGSREPDLSHPAFRCMPRRPTRLMRSAPAAIGVYFYESILAQPAKFCVQFAQRTTPTRPNSTLCCRVKCVTYGDVG